MSAEFQTGGSTGYSNVKWTKTFPAVDSATQFTLDLQAYGTDPNAPQALAFEYLKSHQKSIIPSHFFDIGDFHVSDTADFCGHGVDHLLVIIG